MKATILSLSLVLAAVNGAGAQATIGRIPLPFTNPSKVTPSPPSSEDDDQTLNKEGRTHGQSRIDPRCQQLTDTQKQQTPGCH